MNDDTSHLERAYELLRLERYDLALAEVQRALKRDPRSAAAHVCGAWVLRGQRKLPQAEQAARAALSSSPQPAEAQHILAVVLWEQARLPEAEAAFNATLAQPSPDRATHLASFAHFLATNNRWQEALVLTERALTIPDVPAAVYETHGMVLQGLGRAAEATTAFHAALQRAPRSALAHDGLGVLALERGDADAALEHFHEAIRVQPRSQIIRLHLATALRARYPLYGTALVLVLRGGKLLTPGFRSVIAIIFVATLIFSIIINQFSREMGSTLILLWGFSLFGLVALKAVSLMWGAFVDPLFNTLLALNATYRSLIQYDPIDGVVTASLGMLVLSVDALGVAFGTRHADETTLGIITFFIVGSVIAILFSSGIRPVPQRLRRGMWIGYGATVLGLYGIPLGGITHNAVSYVAIVVALLGLVIYAGARLYADIKRNRLARRGIPVDV